MRSIEVNSSEVVPTGSVLFVHAFPIYERGVTGETFKASAADIVSSKTIGVGVGVGPHAVSDTSSTVKLDKPSALV